MAPLLPSCLLARLPWLSAECPSGARMQGSPNASTALPTGVGREVFVLSSRKVRGTSTTSTPCGGFGAGLPDASTHRNVAATDPAEWPTPRGRRCSARTRWASAAAPSRCVQSARLSLRIHWRPDRCGKRPGGFPIERAAGRTPARKQSPQRGAATRVWPCTRSFPALVGATKENGGAGSMLAVIGGRDIPFFADSGRPASIGGLARKFARRAPPPAIGQAGSGTAAGMESDRGHTGNGAPFGLGRRSVVTASGCVDLPTGSRPADGAGRRRPAPDCSRDRPGSKACGPGWGSEP